MIRHILFWKLQEEYREGEKRREAEARLAASVETLAPIPGLHNAKIGPNLAGGEYDLVFYADLDDRNALAAFRDHPLHDAHRLFGPWQDLRRSYLRRVTGTHR